MLNRQIFYLCLHCRSSSSLTFQAMSSEDLSLWMDALDGKEPVNFAHCCRDDNLSFCFTLDDS